MLIITSAERIKKNFFSLFLAPDFPYDTTCIYEYEAKLLGGLPEPGLARAGLKIHSKVLIIRKANDSIVLKVKTILKHLYRYF